MKFMMETRKAAAETMLEKLAIPMDFPLD